MLSIFKRIPRNISKVRYLGSPLENKELARCECQKAKTVLKSLPPIVTFALTTYCNNRTPCLICDRNIRPLEADSQTNEQVINAVRPLLKTARYTFFHCGGEPLFSKQFDKVIAMIQPPTRVGFATNAMLLTAQKAELMLEKDIMGVFVVSLDAATPEVYRIMRPSSNFQTVVNNIQYYIKRAKELGRKKTGIVLNMTICRTNLQDVPKLVDLAVKVGASAVDYNHLNQGLTHTVKTIDGWDWNYVEQADFKDGRLHDEMVLEAYRRTQKHGVKMTFVGKPFLSPEDVKVDKRIIDELCENDPFQEGEDQVWGSDRHKLLARGVPPCFKPWRETVIQPEGDVRMCYFHDSRQWTLGNVLERDFMAMWNSDVMISERQQFLKNAFSKRCAVSTPCMHRQRQ